MSEHRDTDLPKDIPFIINSKFCKIFFDMLTTFTKSIPVSESKKIFLDSTKYTNTDEEPLSKWYTIYQNILKIKEGSISVLAYKYCYRKAKNYYYFFYHKAGTSEGGQLLLKQFIYQIKLRYLKTLDGVLGPKTSYLDKLRKKAMLKKKLTNVDDKNLPVNLRGLPGFLTATDKKDYLNRLIEEAKTKKFNLLTNLYFENEDKNFVFKDKLKIFEGKYLRTFLINKEDIGKYKNYNTDPNSYEFQMLIEEAARSTDYFKIGDFFVNGARTLELLKQVKFKRGLVEMQKVKDKLNLERELREAKMREQMEENLVENQENLNNGNVNGNVNNPTLSKIESTKEKQDDNQTINTRESKLFSIDFNLMNKRGPTPPVTETPLEFLKKSHTLKMSITDRNKLFIKSYKNLTSNIERKENDKVRAREQIYTTSHLKKGKWKKKKKLYNNNNLQNNTSHYRHRSDSPEIKDLNENARNLYSSNSRSSSLTPSPEKFDQAKSLHFRILTSADGSKRDLNFYTLDPISEKIETNGKIKRNTISGLSSTNPHRFSTIPSYKSAKKRSSETFSEQNENYRFKRNVQFSAATGSQNFTSQSTNLTDFLRVNSSASNKNKCSNPYNYRTITYESKSNKDEILTTSVSTEGKPSNLRKVSMLDKKYGVGFSAKKFKTLKVKTDFHLKSLMNDQHFLISKEVSKMPLK